MPTKLSDTPLTELKGVGDALAKKFAVIGIKTITDLLNYYPKRYEDYSEINSINSISPGLVSIKAKIKQISGRYVRRGMHISECVVSDETGSVRLVWFNQPYRANNIKVGQEYFISGQYELRRQRFSILNPSVELANDIPTNTARILAIYKETKGLNSRQIRSIVKQVLNNLNIDETLPPWILKEQQIISRTEAVKFIHQPNSNEELSIARKRLGFEEVFGLTLASLLNKRENQSETAIKIRFNEKLAKDFVSHLPFQLTDAQRKTTWQIYQDLEKVEPMNRLIEGDVGSGKTAVATMAALMILSEELQVAFMAPTEILARQHAESISRLLKPLGMHDSVALLVGSLSSSQKAKTHEAIKSGNAKFIIGTQALIQEKVDMSHLALIIVDEQHRFGVEQRKTLMAKAGFMPHVLSLTATPIPRSLALTLYGELDISILDQKPPGRIEIKTKLVSPNSKKPIYEFIETELSNGKQMFVVCPLISESGMIEANSTEKVFKELSEVIFKQFNVGLLHGKMKADEKQQIMQKFIDKKIDILVSTTVIEVGVDVPNASIMMIESPERFGLAQLHQLRGRVGRGKEQGYCFLMLSDSQSPTRRLRALESSSDGFKLAELDLDLRGPGAIYGTSQHGQLDLRIAKLSDTKLISSARKSAHEFISKNENLLEYKELAERVNRLRSVTNLN